MVREGNVRDRILDAAVGLLRDAGVRRLAQPQVARAARVPQGHLTYYFPKKSDMLAAVAGRFVEMLRADFVDLPGGEFVKSAKKSARKRALDMIRKLVRDHERTRMLLGLLVEADSDAALREQMVNGAGFVKGLLAHAMERDPSDPDVDIALAALWGLGLSDFLFRDTRDPAKVEALLERLTVWLDHAPPPARGTK